MDTASDTPRYGIRMELEGPSMAEGLPVSGMDGRGPMPEPLVLRWTDADEVEGVTADEEGIEKRSCTAPSPRIGVSSPVIIH